KGNEKGGVEGTHGFIEDNFFRPIPDFADFDELNSALAVFCDASLTRVIAPNAESIGERFARERPLLQPLPSVLPRACASTMQKSTSSPRSALSATPTPCRPNTRCATRSSKRTTSACALSSATKS